MFSCAEPGADVDVIPTPASVSVNSELCDLASLDGISFDAGLENEAEALQSFLLNKGIALEFREKADMSLRIDPQVTGPEGYRLNVSKGKVVVEGSTAAGVFYGIVTMAQQINSHGLKCGVIEDSTRYSKTEDS